MLDDVCSKNRRPRRNLPKEIQSFIVVKRTFDIIGATILIIILSPLLLLIALLLRIADGPPVLFRHKRIGMDGEPFLCLKFRTMKTSAEEVLARHLTENEAAREEWAANVKLRSDPRILPFIGRLLRESSLDELPQLFNVLRGEMSLVGPRPVPAGELARYGLSKACYVAVRPGMTGLWQVSGRNTTSYERRIELDCEYVMRQSLWLDMIILLRTVGAVLTRKGAS